MVHKKKKEKKGAPAWMTSFADMVTLLLTFFILMFNMNDITGRDFYLVLSSFKGSLGMFQGGSSLSKGRLEELGFNMLNLPSRQQGRALAKSLKRAIEAFKPEIQSKKIRVMEDERGLVITLSGDAYFAPGSARLREDTKGVLNKVAHIVRLVPNLLRIEGHTDNRPIPPRGVKEGYETNWELSSARAISVLRYLAEEKSVRPEQMSSVAYGQFRPIDDNNMPEGRAYNRRVDLVILRDIGIVKSKNSKINRPLPDEEWR